MSTAPAYSPIRPWDESWWEYAARDGLPMSVGRRASQRIERGPGSYVTRRKPVRDYLSEPLDWLSLPLGTLKSGRF
jgi:hypothetical protein